jgi:hypothetical protein
MAKQYQSIGSVVNEPSDTQREYQSLEAVAQTETIGAAATKVQRLAMLGVG